MIQMMGGFAEFERALIRKRVLAGLERARAKGTRLGRPPVPAKVERAVLKARNAGKGIRAIAREVGCGVSTVQRLIAE